MLKRTDFLGAVVILAVLAFTIPGASISPSGSWVADPRYSDAQMTTDGTTDFGKTKMAFTVGFARLNGRMKIDNNNPAASTFDLAFYPATSMVPPIDESGKFLSYWLANLSNHTLVCFHSKGFVRTADGKMQTSGDLVLTRVDRNVELTANEAYNGPVYGPPVVHRLTREATFVFDFPAAGSGQKGRALASGTTTVVREDFPQLLKAVLGTFWPTVVQDEKCQSPSGASEGYSGSQCTGTFLSVPVLPEAPHAGNNEDYPGPAGFNEVVGERMTIALHMRLMPLESKTGAGG